MKTLKTFVIIAIILSVTFLLKTIAAHMHYEKYILYIDYNYSDNNISSGELGKYKTLLRNKGVKIESITPPFVTIHGTKKQYQDILNSGYFKKMQPDI